MWFPFYHCDVGPPFLTPLTPKEDIAWSLFFGDTQKKTYITRKAWWKTLQTFCWTNTSNWFHDDRIAPRKSKVMSDEHSVMNIYINNCILSIDCVVQTNLGLKCLVEVFLKRIFNIFSYMLGGYVLTSRLRGFPKQGLLFSCWVGPNRGCFRCLWTLWEGGYVWRGKRGEVLFFCW